MNTKAFYKERNQIFSDFVVTDNLSNVYLFCEIYHIPIPADEAVLKAVKECEETLGDTGRVLLRASGTEPVLRVMAEAQTLDACEREVYHIIDAMKASGHLLKIR